MNSEENSLTYRLVNEGYDVWMTNTRGNINSYEHMSPKTHSVFKASSQYWDFSFDHMGEYDLPATIDYILERTHQTKCHYVGHSQGTTDFFVANALSDTYGEKIASFNGIGPVMYLGNVKSPLVWLASWLKLPEILMKIHFYNLGIIPNPVSIVLRNLAIKFRTTVFACLELIFGYDTTRHIDLERISVMARNEPGGTSV
jgi:pimeloyl-ACP methyl ester carboxylesterase